MTTPERVREIVAEAIPEARIEIWDGNPYVEPAVAAFWPDGKKHAVRAKTVLPNSEYEAFASDAAQMLQQWRNGNGGGLNETRERDAV